MTDRCRLPAEFDPRLSSQTTSSVPNCLKDPRVCGIPPIRRHYRASPDDTPTQLSRPAASTTLGVAVTSLARLRQHIVQFDDLHPAIAHLGHEVEVVACGVLHPQHVVEEQGVAIAGGESGAP